RTDVYAFGLVAQEVVSGVPPGVEEGGPRLPSAWNRPIRRATSTAPSRRYESPAALVRALRRGHRPAMVALAVTLIAVLAVVAGLRLGSRTAGLVSSRRPSVPAIAARVAVVPVDGSPSTAAVAEALRTELSLPGLVRANTEEEVWPAIRTAPPSTPGAASSELLETLRARAGSDSALLVSASASGSVLKLSMALHRTRDGEHVAATELTLPPADFPEIASRAGAWARQVLGAPALGASESTQLRRAHAPTLESAEALALAASQQRLDHFSSALPLVEQVLRAAPTLATALDLHAEVLAGLGRMDAAGQVRVRAAEAAQGLPELLRLRIERSYWASVSNGTELKRVKERLLALTPDDPSVVLATLGTEIAERRRRLQSLRTAGSLVTLDPRFDKEDASLALQAGDPRDGLAAIERGEQKLSGFEDRLRRVGMFTWLKGNALKQLGRFEDALAAARSAVETYRAEKELYGLAGMLYFASDDLHDLRQWGAAVDSVRQSRSVWSQSGADLGADDDIMLCDQLADNLMHLGRADEAARELDDVASRHPRECAASVNFLENHLEVAIARGRISEAQGIAGVLEGLGEADKREGGPLLWLARELDDLKRMEAIQGREQPPATSGFASLMLEEGDLEHVQLAEMRLDSAPRSSWSGVPLPKLRTDGFGARSAFLRLESRLALARGDLRVASEKESESLASALRYRDAEVEWAARLQLARVRLAERDRTGADQALAPLVALARAGGYRLLALEVDLVRIAGRTSPAARRRAAQKLEQEAAQLGFRRLARLAREAGNA
ncbi:MAG TPA: hypothetical protein VFF12_19065, partial [Myxococcaceae bacterium]|nr:hypothetical protein [Myxococcaceae bacterium]